MLGAIIGDIIGSRFEHHNFKKKGFVLFDQLCQLTDDSVMTLAVAKALMESKDDYSDLSKNTVDYLQTFGKMYPYAGYGGVFRHWIFEENPQPYNSWGNGSAMRISPVAHVAKSMDEVKKLSRLVTEVTHNHPEGIKGAEATAVAAYLALNKSAKEEIEKYINDNYYPMNFTIDEIRDSYKFDVSCQGSVPQSLKAFFESNSYEDCIRNAISIGGDSDTIAAIAGAVAEAYYGIPRAIVGKALPYFDDTQKGVLLQFLKKYDVKPLID